MRADLLFPLTLMTIVLLAGCASTPPEQPVMSTQGTTLVQTAQVTNVRDITIRGGRPSGLGSFAGAILGGIAGSRIGSGNGSAAAGVGGALVGGMTGQRIEESGMSRRSTELTLRFDNGELRTYQVEHDEIYRAGDTVKVTTSGGITRVTH